MKLIKGLHDLQGDRPIDRLVDANPGPPVAAVFYLKRRVAVVHRWHTTRRDEIRDLAVERLGQGAEFHRAGKRQTPDIAGDVVAPEHLAVRQIGFSTAAQFTLVPAKFRNTVLKTAAKFRLNCVFRRIRRHISRLSINKGMFAGHNCPLFPVNRPLLAGCRSM